MDIGARLEITCTDVDDNGAGLGKIDGRRVHVAGALPGEQVAAIVEHVSRQSPTAWARLVSIEAPSPERRPPACPAFGTCGGCVLQHLAYHAQLDWKRRRVAEAFAGAPALDGVTIDACVPSPTPLGYRNKSKLVAAQIGDGGRLVLGAYVSRSHEVVDLAGCRIAEPPLDETAAALREILDEAGVRPYDERTLTGNLRHVVLRSNHAGEVLAVWIAARPILDGAGAGAPFPRRPPGGPGGGRTREPDARQRALLGSRRQRPNPRRRGDDRRADRGRRPRRAPAAFAGRVLSGEPGRGRARLCRDRARGSPCAPADRIVDAYSGVGGIALALAPRAARGHRHRIARRRGRRRDGLRAVERDRQRPLRRRRRRRAADRHRRADLVVLNPPRKGCSPRRARPRSPASPRAPSPTSPAIPTRLARDLGRSPPTATARRPSPPSTCSPTPRTSRRWPSSRA